MSPFIPDATPLPAALTRTTHLAIGAHQDDLEFMAFHGISQCYEHSQQWFTGITCTDGGGSPRSGPYANYSDQEMKALREKEQTTAAEIGRYSAQYQLGYSSAQLREGNLSPLVTQISDILQQTLPTTIYCHSPADKHPTHLAVFAATLAALRHLPSHQQVKQLFGCEVWRDLDWLPDSKKVALDVSAYPELAAELNTTFQSQIAGGKNYHQAIMGRRTAHATLSQPHTIDRATQVTFALDLMPLLLDHQLCPKTYLGGLIADFAAETESALHPFFP